MRRKRVLITGGCGLIGSEVVRLFLARGHAVRVVDDLSKGTALPPSAADFLKTDLADPAAARRALRGADIVIHMAARLGGIGYFNRLPARILAENTRLLASVFEGAADAGVDRIVYLSSSMVYERATSFPSRETDVDRIPPPRTAYGFSKLAGEAFCRAFHQERNLPYAIVRPFNAYGPHEEAGARVGEAHVIPDLLKKIMAGQDPVEILGNGTQTRCFTHVRDIADGIWRAATLPAAENEDFNLSSSRETPIADLARTLARLAGRKNPIRLRSVKGFAGDVRRRIPSVAKARRLLGWRARVPLAAGLEEVVLWHRSQAARARPAAASLHRP